MNEVIQLISQQHWLLPALPCFPLLLALAIMTGVAIKPSYRLAPFVLIPAFLVGLLLDNGSKFSIDPLLLGAHFRIDQVSRLFLLMASVLWFCSLLYSNSYFDENAKKRSFFSFMLLALAGNLGLIVAADSISYYFFFALMSFSSYGLVVADRDKNPEARRAGRLYISLVIAGELLLFMALAISARHANSLLTADISASLVHHPWRDVLMGSFILGFGIKAGLIGLHVWLPLAHSVAPTPSSAVLSGSMIKAGVLGWLVFLPLGQANFVGFGHAMIIAGLLGTFYGVVMGLGQHKAKAVLAYSSVSQMGLVALLIGVAMLKDGHSVTLTLTIALFVLHHGLIKAGLFLSVGIQQALGHSRLPIQAMPFSHKLCWLLILYLALSLAGAPLTSGMVCKYFMKTEVETLPISTWVLPLLSLSSITTTLLLARFVYLLWTAPPSMEHSSHSAPKGMWSAWLILCATSVLYPILVPMQFKPTLWTSSLLVDTTFLIAVAFGIVLISIFLTRRKHIPWPSIPPGDIVVFIEAWLLWLSRNLERYGRLTTDFRHRFFTQSDLINKQLLSFEQTLRLYEYMLSRWEVAVASLVMLGIIFSVVFYFASQ